MLIFKKKLAEKLEAAVKSAFPDAALDDAELFGMLEYPPDDKMGDLALPCFKLSQTLRSAPPKIASAVADALGDLAELESVSVEGGYLNFRISPAYLVENVLEKANELGDDYGRSDEGEGKTVVLDYSSPNVCKPFHIGHLGTTLIGHSIKLLYEFAGYKCVGINYLGDWGTQFGKQIVAFKRWGDRETVEKGGCDELVRLYVRFHEEAEKDAALEDEARAEFHKLEEGDEENYELWKWFVGVSLADIQTARHLL